MILRNHMNALGETWAPEVQYGKQRRGGLSQQASQPLCADGAEALSAAECHVALALGPNAANQPHGPVRVHLPHMASDGESRCLW
jgi:hypothetical protein